MSAAKALPREITSYDLLKTFAVVIMLVDHIGAYFFPDFLWWRSIGRIGFPIWFFLVGHASGRDLPFKLWGSALLLVGANFVTGMPIFPLNALVTIILIRLLIDPVMSFSKFSLSNFWGRVAILILLVPITYSLCEYGTLGLMTAMFGYMVRNRDKFDEKLIFQFMVTVLITFLMVQYLTFEFTIAHFAVMAVGTALIRLMLLDFKPKSYPELTKKCGGAVTWVFQFCGRKTLEIYVAHLLLFKGLCLLLGFEHFGLFEWSWF